MVDLIVTVLLAALIIALVIYFFYPIKKKGIPKAPIKKSARKDGFNEVPYYSDDVVVEDELLGMKMIWDSYTDRVENFIKYLENSKGTNDPKVISTLQEIEGEYVKMKKRLRPFLRDGMIEKMDKRILYARQLANKKFRY